ncbi:MAG: type II secretion system minor pseudopilin GspH [Gammaproteobacteria bacterium]|nr:type II secretion system minor pseudopilin GspH [Gammaproteobacteria bacterium]
MKTLTRISVTPTCSARGRGSTRAHRRAAGFTLLELLLVVTIIGILASVVMLGATDVGRQRTIRAEAERLVLAVELARDESRLRNAVWGLRVDGGTYRFLEYDDAGDEWHGVERREFASDATENNVEFSVGRVLKSSEDALEPVWNLESRGGETRATGVVADDEAPVPDVVIYPGGEMTPFRIIVSGGDAYVAWVARSDGIQRTRAVAENEVDEADDDLQDWLHDAGIVQ